MSYNGWKNYETWLVNLWLINDEYSDSVLREYANTDDVTGLQDYVTELAGGYGSAVMKYDVWALDCVCDENGLWVWNDKNRVTTITLIGTFGSISDRTIVNVLVDNGLIYENSWKDVTVETVGDDSFEIQVSKTGEPIFALIPSDYE